MKKLTESQIRQVIKEELKNLINENQVNTLHQQVKSHIKELGSLAKEAGQDQALGLDLPNLTKEFVNKFKSSDQIDPMAYVLAAASAWLSLYASDTDR